MKRIFSLVLAILMLCCFGACKSNEAPLVDVPVGTNATYDVLNIGAIPVGMWVTPPDEYRTDEAFKTIADCGINMVNGFAYYENEDDEILSTLDACEANGLRFLYSSLIVENYIRQYNESKNVQIIQDAMAQIAKFADHPAYAGQLFLDEPSVAYYDTLADFINIYRQTYINKLPYVNMLPYYAVGPNTYLANFNSWMSKVNPSMYSYDSYPLIDYDPSETTYETEMSDYYYNLDLLRANTMEYGIPMWSFVATVGYETSGANANEPNRRMPSREDLRWEVFSNLAFGSKGIQYYCYWNPGGTNTGALISRAGEPTDIYYYAQEVNAEFKTYGSILLNSDAVGVMMNDYRRNGFHIYSTPLTRFGAIKKVEGNRYVIGCFSDKDTGKKSVLITPTTPRDDIELVLTMHSSVKEVTAYVSGVPSKLQVKNNELKLSIKHGDALFIQL